MEFDEEEIQLLTMLIERVVPSDDSPGAVEAQAIDFIREICEEDERVSEQVKVAIRLLRDKDFVSLPDGGKDELLSSIDHNEEIKVLISLVQQGYLISPISWPSMGFVVTA